MKSNPVIETKTIHGNQFIYFTFSGKLTLENAKNAVLEWKEQIVNPNTKYSLIWNCLDMKGYEPLARSCWQKALKELKENIGKIWLISDSSVIIAGARIISLFTAFDICTVKSESAIFENDSLEKSP